MQEFGWSPSAVLLRFLLNGQADQLYLQLSGMTSGGMYPGYYPTTSTPSFPDLVCPGMQASARQCAVWDPAVTLPGAVGGGGDLLLGMGHFSCGLAQQ
jgi:hypothetical protein